MKKRVKKVAKNANKKFNILVMVFSIILSNFMPFMPILRVKADTRTKITEVDLTIEDFDGPSYGDAVGEIGNDVPITTVTKTANGVVDVEVQAQCSWNFYDEDFDNYSPYFYDFFVEGKYQCQGGVRLDYDGDYYFDEDTIIKINGVVVEHDDPEYYGTDMDFYSQEYSINSKKTLDEIKYLGESCTWFDDDNATINEEFGGREFDFSLMTEVVVPFDFSDWGNDQFCIIGGDENYTFTKVSGPSWLSVSSDGKLSGKPTALGENGNLVVRITDTASHTKELSFPIGETYPAKADREKITSVALTADIDEVLTYFRVGHDSYFNIDFNTTDERIDTSYWSNLYKKNGNAWEEYDEDEFVEGTYRIGQPLKITWKDSHYCMFSDSVNVTVNGKTWNVEVDSNNEELIIYSDEYDVQNDGKVAVRFDTYPADAKVGSQLITSGSKATRPENPVDEHYNFINWYADEDLTTEFDFNTPITSDTTIYASWEGKEYTITIDSNGGTPVEPIVAKYWDYVQLGEYIPTRAGYTFTGWLIDGELNNPGRILVVEGNQTIQAQWKQMEYSVRFLCNGEYCGQSIGGKRYNDTLTLKTPQEYGIELSTDQVFTGYNIDDVEYQPGDTYTISDPVNPNVYVYVQYEDGEQYYTLTFDTNGGSSIDSVTVPANQSVERPTDPTKSGFTFDGWYLDNGTWTAEYSFGELSGNLTIYAKWVANVAPSCTISYDSSEGTLTINPTKTDNITKEEFITPNGTRVTASSMSITESGRYYAQIYYSDGTATVSCVKDVNIPTVPTLSLSENTTYAKSATATVTLADSGSGLSSGTYTLKYAWSKTPVDCASMTDTTTITAMPLSQTATVDITITDKTGAGKLYVCNSEDILNTTGAKIAANTLVSADMYLDNEAPKLSVEGENLGVYTQTQNFSINISDAESGLKAGTYRVKYALGNSTTNYTCDSTEMTNIVSITATEGAKTASSETISISNAEASRITLCSVDAIQDVVSNGIDANSAVKKDFYVDGIAPTMGIEIQEADNKTANITLTAKFAKLVGGTYNFKYAFSESEVACSSMTETETVEITDGAANASISIAIDSQITTGKIFVCNVENILDKAGNMIIANTLLSSDVDVSSQLSEILNDNDYTVQGSFVTGFTLGDTIDSIKAKLGDENIVITGSNGIIATGVVISKGDESYAVVIRGDTNGDGEITPLDYVRIKNNIMGTTLIEGAAYIAAADYDNDDEIAPLDYVKVKNYIMNGGV